MKIQPICLLLGCLVVASACDDGAAGGGETPADMAVTTDGAPDQRLDDMSPPDAAPESDAMPPDMAVIDAMPEPDAAPPPDMAIIDAGCQEGMENCACGINDFCAIGLECVDGVCLPPCPPGTDGCPCDAGECGDALYCDADRCRPAADCDELACLEHQLCDQPEGEGPGCLEECEEGWAWSAEEEDCVAVVPPTCEELGCADQGRTCVEDGAPRCGDCIEGRIVDGDACRVPIACDVLDCVAQNRACLEAAGQDAQCGDCIDGFVDSIAGCIPQGCEALNCMGQNRVCEMGAETCGGCLDGFNEVDGACVAEPEGCAALNCGAQNRTCVAEPEPACGACIAGFQEEDGACVPPPAANCDPDAPGSILAGCAADNRGCVVDGEGARCEGCADGFVQDADGACVAPVVCEDLDCGALGRTCDGEPFAACGDCQAGTRPENPDDPASRCVAPRTCAETPCEDGEFCLEGVGNADAMCSPSPCDDGEAFRADTNACVACDLLCGEEGETGEVWPFTQAFSDDCVCETESGFYADIAGAIRAQPCDADGDGWVRLSARGSLESDDEAIRDNARCQLREVTQVALQNELGQRYVLRSCEDGLAKPDDPICPLSPIGLYETARNDDAFLLSQDNDVPAFAADGVGRPLQAAEVNSLTKACVSVRADHNSNGIADVNEHHAIDPPAELDPALRPFLELSYFVELHRSYYEAPADGGAFGTYVIAERSRCAAGFELGYADGEGDYWRSCMRNRDAGYDDDPDVFTPVGYDFARFSCDAATGTCPTPPPVIGAGPADEVAPHALCEVTPPDDGVWRGMSHHSQFRCVVVTNNADVAAPRSLAPQEITRDALYNGVQGTRTWQVNACRVACPADDPSCANDCGDAGCATSSEAPGGLANPSDVVLDCTPTLQDDTDAVFPAGTVAFVSSRYVDVEGAYARGCLNEWAPSAGATALPWKSLCPGYAENPDGVVGDANSGNFGRLLCGCGFNYGGPECDLGCPSLAFDSDGDRIFDVDIGGLHYGGDVDDPLCDGGYCPNDPTALDGGRRGFWMCGAFSVTSMHNADAASPHALTGGGFTLRGGVMPHGFSGSSCENDNCAQGWSSRPANIADLDPR